MHPATRALSAALWSFAGRGALQRRVIASRSGGDPAPDAFFTRTLAPPRTGAKVWGTPRTIVSTSSKMHHEVQKALEFKEPLSLRVHRVQDFYEFRLRLGASDAAHHVLDLGNC